ncbi:MAG: 3-isopropylmalate dehydratase small subunit [Chloroflexi bacterium]|nr:3-isopropylmalate dehydratase small subunit [Chloroflexota bacterium]
MDPYVRVTGKVAPLDRANVDTDQIIPAVHLKRVERTGFGQFLFEAWRKLPNGRPNPDFVLNNPKYRDASVLVAGPNFGSGSSREHAPWALQDYGFRTVIAPSFADIFRNNCYQNGMLPVVLPQKAVDHIIKQAQAHPGYQVTVDLERCLVTGSDEFTVHFEIDDFRRHCLLNGLDDIGLSLQYADKIAAYEKAHNIT